MWSKNAACMDGGVASTVLQWAACCACTESGCFNPATALWTHHSVHFIFIFQPSNFVERLESCNPERRPNQLPRCHRVVEGVSLLLLLLPVGGRVSGRKHFLPEGPLTRTLTSTVTTLYSQPDQHTQATLGGCTGTRTRGFLFIYFIFRRSVGCGCKMIDDEMLADGLKFRLSGMHQYKEKKGKGSIC